MTILGRGWRHRFLRGRSVVTLVAALSALGPIAAAMGRLAPSAASGWTVQPTPSAGEGSSLSAVSCTSPNACIAVGIRGVSLTLAERWDGTAWSIQHTPTPQRRGPGSWFNDVSCPSASFCIAVGQINYNRGKVITPHVMSERWNGARWSLLRTPNPPGGEALFGVSCASKSACMAIGTGHVALRWNGGRWSLVPTPHAGVLERISCPSADECTAVGFGSDDAKHQYTTLAERWNGRRWSIEATPKLPYGGTLASVSCITPTVCMAVGDREKPGPGITYVPGQALAERWSGGRWKVEPTPRLPVGRGYGNGLAAVSCPSSSSCTAVGMTDRGNTLAEHWSAGRWSIQPTPKVRHRGSYAGLNGASCPSIQTCTAVGGDTAAKTLAERWFAG